jgi:hypothetical protein
MTVSSFTAKTVPSVSYRVAPDSSPVFLGFALSIRSSSAPLSLARMAPTTPASSELLVINPASVPPTTRGLPSTGLTSSSKSKSVLPSS